MTIKENLQGEILIRETSTGKPVDVEEVKKEVETPTSKNTEDTWKRVKAL